MADRPGGEPTEPPSEKRLRDARRKGDIAKSREMISAAVVFGVVALVAAHWIPLVAQLREYLGASLRLAAEAGGASAATFEGALALAINRFFVVALPVLSAAFLSALLANYAQVGSLFTLHPLKPDLKKLDPIANGKNIFGKKALVELLKSLAKLGGIGFIAGQAIWQHVPLLASTVGRPPEVALMALGSCLWTMSLRIGIFAGVLAIADLLHQRFSHQKKLRMTKEEVKREHKESEGDPQHKAERQRLHREVLEHQMLENVAKADVVIVNPDHIAVAIRYDEKEMDAPKVIAKGYRLVAAKIRQIARQHGIPIVRNVPVARALVELELDDEVPAELYEAVATILRFVYERSGEAPPAAEPGAAEGER